MVGIQAIGRRHKPNRRKSPSHHRQTQAKELAGPKVIHRSNKSNEPFFPNLANLCAPLRPPLKKDKEWNWQEKDEKAFDEIK